MKTVTVQVSKAQTTGTGAYRMDISITSSQNITAYLFVKQRIKTLDGGNDDRFVAVASPVQIEDIPQQDPGDGAYFRDSAISLISSDPDMLADTRDQILADLQLTMEQSEQLDLLAVDASYTVTSSSVTQN